MGVCVCFVVFFGGGGVGNILYGINKWLRDDKNNILNEIFWKKIYILVRKVRGNV